ncbi:thiol peroxidase [Clostridium sardiniense]|uniref:Thiol peroxidase n=1 Tax=Clostridium sardiniense TaxID=29369 RepID=A0ABS7L2D7_CLOSR|nr:thiol peroxidase [Clostridium sardiniense]MBY0757200.1 thiol peroxidase [Clostridium sardiniense]MDQ0461623.1 thiol peroxidase [Clostridium sardiniense]
MNITLNGKKVSIIGTEVKVNQKAPDFTLLTDELKSVSLKDTKGKRVFLTVPSLDTPVCDLEIKRFNKEAVKFKDTTIYAISVDLPFAQTRWCDSEGIKNIITLSDYKDRIFGKNYGVYIDNIGLLARAVFVIDENNKVIYVEYCNDVTDNPNYYKVLEVLSK